MADCVLGLDPGFRNFGYAVLRAAQEGRYVVTAMGVVRTAKRKGANVAHDNVRRGKEIAQAMECLMLGARPGVYVTGRKLEALFAEPVQAIHAESMSHPRSASAAAKVTLVWGILIANSVRRNVPLLHMSPQAVKKKVVGTIDASKEHVERVMVRKYGRQIRRLLDGVPRSLHEHAYDALAAATACLGRAE